MLKKEIWDLLRKRAEELNRLGYGFLVSNPSLEKGNMVVTISGKNKQKFVVATEKGQVFLVRDCARMPFLLEDLVNELFFIANGGPGQGLTSELWVREKNKHLKAIPT